VIPFWETYDLGYSFTIENRKNKKIFTVNNLEKDKVIYWSGSVLINYRSTRGIPGNQKKAETEHLRATILNAIKEDRLP
jgi:hypothetical protein